MGAKRVQDTTSEPALTATTTFLPRSMMEEMSLFYDFLVKGIDAEDISYFKKSYETLISRQDTLQVVFVFGNHFHYTVT